MNTILNNIINNCISAEGITCIITNDDITIRFDNGYKELIYKSFHIDKLSSYKGFGYIPLDELYKIVEEIVNKK